MRIVEYQPIVTALANLKLRFDKVVFDVKTAKGMKEAKEARAEIRGYRTSLEAKREELKKPILEQGRLLDSEAKALSAELTKLEKPIDDLIQAEEARRAKEKEEKEKIERVRIQSIQSRMDALRQTPAVAAAMSSAEIAKKIVEIEAIDPNVGFDEFTDLAVLVLEEVKEALKTVLNGKTQLEAEESRLQAQREELARERAELEQLRAAQQAVITPPPAQKAPQAAQNVATMPIETATRTSAEIVAVSHGSGSVVKVIPITSNAVKIATPVQSVCSVLPNSVKALTDELNAIASTLTEDQLLDVLAYAKSLGAKRRQTA